MFPPTVRLPSGGLTVAPKAASGSGGAGGDSELLDQWSFLDTMIERQASSLRAGAQDPEEDDSIATATVASGAELAELRGKVIALEQEAVTLRRHLDRAGKALDAARADRETRSTAIKERDAERIESADTRKALETAQRRLDDVPALRSEIAAQGRMLADLHKEAALRDRELADLRARIASASDDPVLAGLRGQVVQERHLRERAEAKSTDLMRALREAHDAAAEAGRAAAGAPDARATAPARHAEPPPATRNADVVRTAHTPPAAMPAKRHFWERWR